MPLIVHNTRTHKREPFVPLRPGHVGMYVCGPTVYDYSHIGHARSYVVYDTMKRYFRSTGHRVVHVQNFTDVEERISLRAKERGLTPLEYADLYIQHFFEDMDALHVLRADRYPRVSEHIGEMLTMAQTLLKKDAAYTRDCSADTCDVYFDVTSAPHFGELLGQPLKEVAVAGGDDKPRERRHTLDFAIWKAKGDLGITWASPWGEGRPGWHIQCAAMATKYLGETFDLHGGGLDLIFPHHESETAVAESTTGKRYCNYFLHNGFVTLKDEKMSKSTGNFVTVRSLREKHDPEALRLFLLAAPYGDTLRYSEDDVKAAEARLGRWRDGLRALKEQATTLVAPAHDAYCGPFRAALEDNFDFPKALSVVEEAATAPAKTPLEAAGRLAFLKDAGKTLGLLWSLTGEK
ncbi:MAG TPA: cysteine--tRNA ligase [Candidatus Thermoplasmatota archaeon]|nr:cysteine--tRNA ligase [Candidatus Thermoplasmatota archaeon]